MPDTPHAHQPTTNSASISRLIALFVVGFAFCAAAISFGIRSSFGLFILPITTEFGWTVAAISSSLAVQNLLWGATQPLAGMLADRFGVARVLFLGGLLYASGLWGMAQAETMLSFQFTVGIMIGMAQACIGFPIVLGAIGKVAPPEHKGLFMGIGVAGGSFGQLVFAPFTRQLLDHLSWVDTLLILAMIALLPCLLAILISWLTVLLIAKRQRHREQKTANANAFTPSLYQCPDLRSTLHHAMTEQGFLLLVAGFFVCGFQLAFIIVYLPAFAALCGLATHAAPFGIALIGLFNIVGTIVAGMLGDRYRPKIPLAYIYLARSVVTLPLVLLPVTEFSLYMFSIGMGLLWLSTVPLTNGVIFQFYGPRYAATLFGIAFLSHQVGSFIGVYMSGLLFDATQSYDITWWISIFLGIMAFGANIAIRDRATLRPNMSTT